MTAPFAGGIYTGDYLGTAGINTLIAPSCSAISAMIYMNYVNEIKYEDLVSCILGGAVAITAGCYTVSWWAACIIGFIASFIYFWSIWFVRKKLIIDDPLCVTSIHLFCGYFGGFVQGIFGVKYRIYTHYDHLHFVIIIMYCWYTNS